MKASIAFHNLRIMNFIVEFYKAFYFGSYESFGLLG